MNLADKKIIIVTHVYTTGPAQDLKDYLVASKCHRLLFIGHPLFYNKNLKGSGFELYKTGKKCKEYFDKIKNNFSTLTYLRDFCKNLTFVYKNGRDWDLYVGSDNLNALSGIFLRRLGLVKKCVYYVIDYNPKRFSNPILNKIYHKIDQYCVKHSDETWNLSPRMAEGRQRYFNFSNQKQIVVPIGIWYKRFKRLGFDKIDRNRLVYMGHVLKKQGIQHVIDAVPDILKKVPSFQFLVIGGGDYLGQLKSQVKMLGIGKNVVFAGFVDDHKEVEGLLTKSALAVAMYDKYDEQGNLSFTYFSDPGKIKSYLAGGLPILLTDVSYNAHEIEKRECGLIIKPDKGSIVDAVTSILRDETKLRRMRQNASDYAKEFDWENIFVKNLERILD